jgi:hypothetical protein
MFIMDRVHAFGVHEVGSQGASAARGHLLAALAASRETYRPFRHFLLTRALPSRMAMAVAALPVPLAPIDDTLGKRETHNSKRFFFTPEVGARHSAAATVAELFQDPAVSAALERCCGAVLAGASLRVEFCQDTGGFWLEPHTDIGVKKLTLQIFLNQGPDADSLGTDLYDAQKAWAGRIPAGFGNGFLFVPGGDTWHGFERRPIAGVRRSIIVNYVGPEWRARHELAYPSQPIL